MTYVNDLTDIKAIKQEEEGKLNRAYLRMCMRCKTIKHKCICEKKEKTEVEILRDEVREIRHRVKNLEVHFLGTENPWSTSGIARR